MPDPVDPEAVALGTGFAPVFARIGDTFQAALEGATRPLEKVRDWARDEGIAGYKDPYGENTDYSPSSPEALQRAERHPIAAMVGSAVPTALATGGVGGVAGVAARVGGGAVMGSAEQGFQEGRGYGSIDPKELAMNAALGGAGEAVLPAMTHELTRSVMGPPERQGSPAFLRAMDLIERRRGQSGAVDLGSAPVLTAEETTALNRGKSSLGYLRGTPSPELTSALQKTATAAPGTLYRGMRLSPDQVDGIVQNGYILDKYTMASTSRDAAAGFASGVDKRVPVLMRIEDAPKASMAHGYAGDEFPAEKSAILYPGQRYHVVNVEPVTIPGEMSWMKPEEGKLLTLSARAPAVMTPVDPEAVAAGTGFAGVFEHMSRQP